MLGISMSISFSTERDLIGLYRHSLLPETMEVNMRFRSWFRSRLKFKTQLGFDILMC